MMQKQAAEVKAQEIEQALARMESIEEAKKKKTLDKERMMEEVVVDK
jgi:DNA-binding protein H-NS